MNTTTHEALKQAIDLRIKMYKNGCDCDAKCTCDPMKDEYIKRWTDVLAAANTAEKARTMEKWSKWKSGNEYLPFHPMASHVSPAYRSGWNDCYQAAQQVAANAAEAKPELEDFMTREDLGKIDANRLGQMARERPDECFLKGSGVLKLIGAIRQLEREARNATLAAPMGAQPSRSWIDLNKLMPEPEVCVLTWDGKKVGVDWWGSLRHRGDGVTHWFPFEKPPGAGAMYGMHSLSTIPPQQSVQSASGVMDDREAELKPTHATLNVMHRQLKQDVVRWSKAALAKGFDTVDDALAALSVNQVNGQENRNATLEEVATSFVHAFEPDDRLDPAYIAECILSHKRKSSTPSNKVNTAQPESARSTATLYECNDCSWLGPHEETVMCGSVGPLCPDCNETTEPVTRHVQPTKQSDEAHEMKYAQLLEALKPILKNVERDCFSHLDDDGKIIIWHASNSWGEFTNITLGDLRAIRNAYIAAISKQSGK